MEILTGSGGDSVLFARYTGGGGDSVLVNKKEWGGFCTGGILSYTRKIQASYKLEGTALENVESIKYLGVTITKDLK